MTSSKDEKHPVDGRILALDLGEKRIGVAISDELQISVRPLPAIDVTNWKAVLSSIRKTVEHFDAKAVVLGWPLSLDGSEGTQAESVRNTAVKLGKSLGLPVYLQDERLTTVASEELFAQDRVPRDEWERRVDSQAASIILLDFILERSK